MGRSKIIPPKKRYYMILMFITAVVFCGFLSFQNGNGLRSDRFYIYEALCIFMCLLIVLLFEFARNKKDPFDNVFRNYKHIYILYLMGWVVCIADYYLPRTLTPLILIPIVISLTLDVYFGFTLSTILLLSYGLICEAQGTRIICYIFIILIGTVLSSSLKSKGLFCSDVIMLSIFQYLEFSSYTIAEIMRIFENAILAVILLIPALFLIRKLILDYEQTKLLRILDVRYVLIKDMKKYSEILYLESLFTARLCKGIAVELGYDPMLTQAAGMYYRIGEMSEGGAKEAVRLGIQYDFPMRLMNILYEYRGELRKPTTPSSAIAFLVYYIVKTVRRQGRPESKMDRTVSVHKVMNELSNAGFLEQSGLSVSQFVKIRDYLVFHLEEGV